MATKIQATVFFLCLMVTHPVSSQGIFDILNFLNGGGKMGQKGEVIITTFHNINSSDNDDDNQQITIVQSVDNKDMSDTMMDDFDIGRTGFDDSPDFSNNHRFDPREKPAKVSQIDLINTSVARILTKLAKEPDTDTKLIGEIQDQMKTLIEKVRNTISIAIDNDVCIGENYSTFTKKGCKAVCNENGITLPRVQLISIPDENEINKLNSIKPEKNLLTTIDDLLFHIVNHSTEVNQVKKADVVKEDGDKADDKCTLEDNIKCTNFFLNEVVKCSHAAEIAEDRLQLNAHEIVEIINKLFLRLMDVAFQNSSLSDHKISDKLDIIKIDLKNAMNAFIDTLEPASSEALNNNIGTMWEALEKVSNPAHHIVGRKLPTHDDGFLFSKKLVPGQKFFRQYEQPDGKTIDKIKNSNSEYDGDIEDQLKDLFKRIVQGKSRPIEHPRPIVSTTTPLPVLKLNLGKPDSRDFTDIMHFIFSMLDG